MATTRQMLEQAQGYVRDGETADAAEALATIATVAQVELSSTTVAARRNGGHQWRCVIRIEVPESQPTDHYEFTYLSNSLLSAVRGALYAALNGENKL